MQKLAITAIGEADYNRLIRKLERLEQTQSSLLKQIERHLNPSSLPQTEWITRKEFMRRIGVAETMFNTLKRRGLKTKKVGRKTYVSFEEIERYFLGDFHD